jgi:TolB-like protein
LPHLSWTGSSPRCSKRPQSPSANREGNLAGSRTPAPKSDSAPLAKAVVAPERASIAVLPLEDISPTRDNEYYCDGITEEIIADLSQVQSLRVISRTSAMAFKGIRKDHRTIAEELMVRYVVEGSVRKAGNNLRITASIRSQPQRTRTMPPPVR